MILNVLTSFLRSKFKSLLSWSIVFSNLIFFVIFHENKHLIIFIPNVSIWKYGLKLQNKFIFSHLLQINYFLSEICVHTWNDHPQSLGLINKMQKSTFRFSFFMSWFFMVLIIHEWNCCWNMCLNGRWIIMSTCQSLEVLFVNINLKQTYGCFDLIHCMDSSFLWTYW
jgi:hypothetical protein